VNIATIVLMALWIAGALWAVDREFRRMEEQTHDRYREFGR
jgi:hypothetical protein